MRFSVAYSASRPLRRAIILSVTAILMSACSSDTLRFTDNAFSNPFASSPGVDSTPTGSVGAGKPGAALPAVPRAGGPLPPPTVPLAGARPAPVTGALGGVGAWTATGGTPVAVGAGDTVEALSTRYGVPTEALRQANGLAPGAQPRPGQAFMIPVFKSGASPVAAAKPVAARPVAAKPADVRPAVPARKVAEAAPKPPKTVDKPAARSAGALDKSLAKVEPAAGDAKKRGSDAKQAPDRPQKPAIADAGRKPPAPKKETKAAALAAKPKSVVEDDDEDDEKPAKPAKARGATPGKPATKDKVIAAKPADPKPAAPKVAEEKPKALPPASRDVIAKAPAKVDETPVAKPVDEDTDAAPTGSVPKADPAAGKFRWPAKGRIITGYGSGGNEGINIAVPEGAPVKAAEDGVVAYAGDELKRYGKLVLIRHSDGWVTAYAHNGELGVKKGDRVRRGQSIAKAGQTGNVSSPQVHFELRKGATPVDPMKFLDVN
jgi:murein DD-endopeptidase MepM/ murein hydrolase activator NlpD